MEKNSKRLKIPLELSFYKCIGILSNLRVLILLGILHISFYNANAQINVAKYIYNGRMYLVNEEYTNAIRTFNIILTYQEENAEAYFLRGYAKFQLSDYSGAINDFTSAIETDRFITEALYYRAIANVELNNFRHALNDLIQAIDIDDRHTHYYAARGYLHTEFGDTLGAIKDYNQALILEPDNEGVYVNLGVIYMQKKEYDKAMEYANHAAELNPNNKETLLLKGNINQYKEKYTDSKAQYKRVLEIDTNNVRAHFFMAVCHQELKEYDSAAIFFDKTLMLNPGNSVAYYHRALLYLEEENYSDALSDLNEVIEITPKNIYSYHLRGIVHINLENYAEAEADFTQVIELYPFMVDAYKNRAYARGLQNKIAGYYADQSAVDSLFTLEDTELANTDLDYFKSITDFRADFTNAGEVRENKIQYIEQSIRMVSIYHPILYEKTDNLEPILLTELLDFPEIDIELELVNYDYADLSNFEIAELKDKIDNALSQYPDSVKYELFKVLVLGWQMEYSYANTVLDQLNLNYPLSFIAEFIQGNYNYFIGSVMASFDIRHFSLDNAEKIVFSDGENAEVVDYYEKAVENYTGAIKLNPNNSYVYYNRAYVNALLKNYTEAINDYTVCIRSEYEFPEALYNRGLLYIYLNKFTEGCSDLSKSGELGVDNAYRVIYKYCKNQD